MKNKRLIPGAWHHVYSITQDGGVLFYRISDRLCFYTIISVCARRFRMVVLGLSLMFTHFHMMLRAVDIAHLRAFVGTVTSIFTRVINSDRNRTVPLGLFSFMSEAGSDPKLQLAASTVSILPMIVLFLLARRYIVNGVARGGLKG